MKYIIEIPDEVPVSDKLVPFDMCRPSWYLEAYEKGKADAEDEVWEFARHLINVSPSVTEGVYRSMNGGKGIGVAVEMTYQEAKARYDSWKKEKDEIRVGDEIVLYENVKMVVTQVDHGTSIQGVDENGECYECVDCNVVKKTGRHFPGVEGLLKKMRGEQE